MVVNYQYGYIDVLDSHGRNTTGPIDATIEMEKNDAYRLTGEL